MLAINQSLYKIGYNVAHFVLSNDYVGYIRQVSNVSFFNLLLSCACLIGDDVCFSAPNQLGKNLLVGV